MSEPAQPEGHGEDADLPRASLFRLFRQLVLRSGSAGTSFSAFEEIFAPTRHQARIEIQAQSRLVKPAPAPTDPPELEPPGPGTNDRFQGRVVVHRRPPTARG
jgi:hypothetical protein